MTTPVVVDARARRAWPFLPAVAPPDTIWQGPAGELVRVLEDGTAAVAGVEVPRLKSAASDPCSGNPDRRALLVSATPSASGPHGNERPADAPVTSSGARTSESRPA